MLANCGCQLKIPLAQVVVNWDLVRSTVCAR